MSDLLPPELLTDEPPITEADLDAYFSAMDSEPDDSAVPDAALDVAAWTVDGPRLADWAMAKVAEAHATIRDAAERRDAYIQRVVDAYDAQTKRSTRTAEFFSGHLIAWALHERVRSDGRVKTLTTPSGKVTTRETSAKVIVTDEALAVVWARQYVPAAVKVVESIRLEPLREAVAVVEVPTRVVMSPCACVVQLDTGDDPGVWAAMWTVGSGRECLSCGEEGLVGRWLETRLLPSGGSVAGLAVEPATVTGKVVVA